MRSKLLNDGREKTYALIFDAGDEVVSCLLDFARRHRPQSAHFSAIGAFESVTLAYFDWQSRKYQDHPLNEQVEVLMLGGDIAWKESGEPALHAHVVVARHDTTTRGGHLKKAIVRPTLELILEEYPQHLQRKFSPEAGLALIDIR